MKRIIPYLYILMWGLVSTVLTGCSNDDIPVGRVITFKVDPSKVVSSLLESSPGDLSSIDPDENLYVSLYVYNETGKLVAHDRQKFKDYTHIMNTVQNIELGDHIVVTSTQIITDDDFKYWDITGIENLSTFSVKDKGFIGGKSKILGLSAKKIHVDEATKEISIDVECAGAVALVMILDWNKYSDVAMYGLVSNKSCDEVTLDQNGGLYYSVESKDQYSYWMAQWDYSPEYFGASGYTFMFPYTNIDMSFVAITTNNKSVNLGGRCICDIEKNHTYLFAYDVEENQNFWSDETESSSSKAKSPNKEKASSDNLLKFDPENKTIRIVQ